MMTEDEANFITRITAEIEIELENIKYISTEFERFQCKYPEIDEFLLRALCSFIADFYNAVEKVFCLISEERDGGLPEGEMWHKRLLTNMRMQIGVRPAVITADLFSGLLPYLGFRHVFRQAYGFELDKQKVFLLARNLQPVIETFKGEVRRFCEKLKKDQ